MVDICLTYHFVGIEELSEASTKHQA